MEKDIVKTTYDAYWRRYEEYLKKKNTNKKSIDNRKSSIKCFFEYLCKFDRKPLFEEIKRANIETFLYDQEELGKSADTLNRYYSFLKDFFLFYEKDGTNTNRIFSGWKYKKEKDTVKKYIDENEVSIIYKTLNKKEQSEKTLREKVAFLILTYTGCTKSELCDLDFYNFRSEINEKDKAYNYIVAQERKIYLGKNIKKQRVLPLCDSIIDIIQEYREWFSKKKDVDIDGCHFLFLSTYNEQNNNIIRLNNSVISSDFKEIIEECNLDKKISMQTLRNTFIKKMLDKNVSIQIIKGLTGLSITSLQQYMDLDVNEYEEIEKKKVITEKHPYKVIFG